MDLAADLPKIKELVENSKQILIATHENPTFDSIGSSLALYLGLTAMGKKVTIVCPDPMTVELSNFVGVNKFAQELAKKNFIVSLDYVEGSIEKVSYNIEGDKFNLVIEPRPNFPVFTADKVHFNYSGEASDFIITVDTIHLGGLKKLYEDGKELFADKTIVNIDNHANNAGYGMYNLVEPRASSTAEIVAQLMASLGVQLSADIATNLLNAVYSGTNSFQNINTTATAFQLAAACLKSGGKRFNQASKEEELPKTEFVATPATEAAIPDKLNEIKNEVKTEVKSQVEEGKVQAPPDWLKPKIFSSKAPGPSLI